MQRSTLAPTRRVSPETYAKCAKSIRDRVAKEREIWAQRWERDLAEAEEYESLALDG